MPIMKNGKIIIEDVRIASSAYGLDHGWLLIEGGRIQTMTSGAVPAVVKDQAETIIQGKGALALPGFIDLHTHGAAGVNLMDADEAGFQKVSQFFASHGVTGFLATSWSASSQSIEQMLATVKMVMGRETGAALLGVHLEGPFINPARAGAQSPREIRPATSEEVLPYLDSGLVKLVTLAPEIEENQWLMQACVERGIRVSVGHSDATYLEMRHAVERGLSHVSHTFNGMRAFNHREPGVVGAALEIDDLTCEVIADGVHVHPAAIRLLLRSKPGDKVVLVTDSIPAAGLPPGVIYLQGRKVRFSEHEARLQDGTLAGSVLTMDQALRNLEQMTGKAVEALYRYSSQNAARVLGLADSKGVIQEGKDADLALLDTSLQVELTMVSGKIVYQRQVE